MQPSAGAEAVQAPQAATRRTAGEQTATACCCKHPAIPESCVSLSQTSAGVKAGEDASSDHMPSPPAARRHPVRQGLLTLRQQQQQQASSHTPIHPNLTPAGPSRPDPPSPPHHPPNAARAPVPPALPAPEPSPPAPAQLPAAPMHSGTGGQQSSVPQLQPHPAAEQGPAVEQQRLPAVQQPASAQPPLPQQPQAEH